ncbi:pseudouridine synthase [Roseateles toxinivorans]|uniref:tRNA pseudouridine32 synthase/23S rRNA pseudouridine746 synthase n=1 Tax=Roseateles toxinivorans TaxID=270368 RepID=A0A4R6QJN0_9BURK|nr:pseudouridine synthase [Roseateles toxinivorans]TDP62581.1 tRNA pseudouridine32 synthase/23S rRNA pseudouridine746 synthase [Roseateles toxinivorans]
MSGKPPARDGVSPSCIALPPGDWPTVLAFLQQRFGHVCADDWRQRMQRGEVLDAQGLTLAPGAGYRPHAKLFYYRSLPAEQPVPFKEQILFQDELLVAVDKPHFLPVTPGGRYLQETLLVRLKRRLGLDELQPLHRLDRETAGLVLFSVRPDSRDAYHALFREREVSKCYEAIAPWRDDLSWPMTRSSRLAEGESFMRMQEVPGEPNAHTRISPLERQGGLARYRLEPATGQRHQLRVHMCALGLPIVNDQIYPVHQPELAENDYSRPLQLLARTLAFTDPVSGQVRRFESGLSLRF